MARPRSRPADRDVRAAADRHSGRLRSIGGSAAAVGSALRDRPRSARWLGQDRDRLTAMFALLLTVILVAFAASVVLLLRSDLHSAIDHEVRDGSAKIATD